MFFCELLIGVAFVLPIKLGMLVLPSGKLNNLKHCEARIFYHPWATPSPPHPRSFTQQTIWG